MKRVRSKLLGFSLKPLADVASAPAFVKWTLEKQSVKVKSRTAADYRELSSRKDIIDRAFGILGVVCAGLRAHRIDEIDRVVRHACKLLGGGLCSSDIHFAVDLHRVTADYLTAKSLGKCDGESGLTRSGMSNNGNYLRLRHFSIGILGARAKSSG